MKKQKKYILLMTLLFAAAPAYSQVIFQRWYGSNGVDEGHDIVQTPDGGYAILGYTNSYGAGSMDFYLIKTDSLGDTLWTKTYGGSSWDDGQGILKTTDGGYLLVGHTESYGAGVNDVYLIKTDPSGNPVWTKVYGGPAIDYCSSVVPAYGGGYLVGGWTTSSGAGSFDVYIIRIDNLGDTIWTRTYGGVQDDRCCSIARTADSCYMITGWTSSYGAGLWDVYLMKIDDAGDTLWTRTYGGISDEAGYSIKQARDGGYIIGGFTFSYGAGSMDYYLIKTDPNGDTLWTRTFGDSAMDWGSTVIQASDGGYVMAGWAYLHGQGEYDVWIIKTDPLGDTLWTRAYGGNRHDYAFSIIQTVDSGFAVTGFTWSYGSGANDVYLIKTDANGIASVAEQNPVRHPVSPTIQLIVQPNPFHDKSCIRVGTTMEHVGPYTIDFRVYDIMGRLVKIMQPDITSYSVSTVWDGTNDATDQMPDGVYLLRAMVKGTEVWKKIIKTH